MPKPSTAVTKTLGPIHFEDLDPHRFEDLVRELVYDYKDWQSIEATGRGGSDEGFDVRAYERAVTTSEPQTEEGEESVEPHPMEGNRWMIQGKREKEIGPTKLRSTLKDVDPKDPPYGYILAAPVNFSKKAYDVFREELRKKGVQEFYLWGKAELENMLHLPKNDRILFTFFGISLVARRRTRATEVRSVVVVKNKLIRITEDKHEFHKSVLIRDLKDVHYPFKDKYPDFDKSPRWREYVAYGHHPLGLRVQCHRYFAYVDREKKEWDFTDAVDLVDRKKENTDERRERMDQRKSVEGVWKCFPRANQAYFEKDGLLRYADIAIVDDKGDVLYDFPHLYVDFAPERGPFIGYFHGFHQGLNQRVDTPEGYKRISMFSKKLLKQKLGKIHTGTPITLNPRTLQDFNAYHLDALFAADNRYAFLKQRDIVAIANARQDADTYLQITHIESTPVGAYLRRQLDEMRVRTSIAHQLERDVNDDEVIHIYELTRVYKHQLGNAGAT